jgi:orotate phosphoribosyltransferase-like protein
MKYLKTFETYTFEDFSHADMEDVKDLLEEGLTPEQIAIELDFSLDKVNQIISSLSKNESFESENKIYIPAQYSGVIMELGEDF